MTGIILLRIGMSYSCPIVNDHYQTEKCTVWNMLDVTIHSFLNKTMRKIFFIVFFVTFSFEQL